jgi:two-component system response regulator PhoP/two-component system response regulator TctD
LIAEDDPLIGSLIVKGLETEGLSTSLVEDGEQAQALGLSGKFDLLILDMVLPNLDGFQVLHMLRSRGRQLPILVVTGRREIDEEMCLAAGADGYLGKPFQVIELVSLVRSLLERENWTPRSRPARSP